MNSIIRWAIPADFEEIGRVMFDAVRNGPSPYSEAQRAAWVTSPRSGEDWNARLASQDIILESDGAIVAGFMSLAAGGYIDFAYIRPDFRGTGLFRRLYCRIEQRAVEVGHRRLFVHASLMAQPAFSAVGFSIQREEEVDLNGMIFRRFEMEKRL